MQPQPATAVITLSLHDALPILRHVTHTGQLDVPPPPVVARGRPGRRDRHEPVLLAVEDRKSTRLNSSHMSISYAVCCLKKNTYYADAIDQICPDRVLAV